MGKNCSRFTSADPRVEDRARPLTQDISTSKSLALNDGLNSDWIGVASKITESSQSLYWPVQTSQTHRFRFILFQT